MQLKKLNREEIAHIHRNHLKRDFPPAEVKPLFSIQSRANKGLYACYGAYDGQGLAAYLFVSTPEAGNVYLLDYLAVCEGRRGQGIGSVALPLLAEELRDKTLLIEVEDPDDTDVASVRETRLRRIAFYERLGARPTGIRVQVFGVVFLIYALGAAEEDMRAALDANYLNLFSAAFRKRHIKYFD